MKPLIATPCYGGVVCANYAQSALRLKSWCDCEFYFRSGESLITRARNDCAAHFMAGDCTHLFFIDADIGFEPFSVLRLLNSGLDVVAGIYPRKSEQLSFPIDVDAIAAADANGFAEAKEAPTGFMCIRRNVFERLTEAGVGRHALFDTMIDGDDYLSEDYAFCRRWRAIGGKVHIDPSCALSHQGAKLFTGSIRELMV